MQALIEWVECLVVVLAASAFAHFGADLKMAPASEPAAVVRRVPVATARMTPAVSRAESPCPETARGAHRA